MAPRNLNSSYSGHFLFQVVEGLKRERIKPMKKATSSEVAF
jgi:hypothetical protein